MAKIKRIRVRGCDMGTKNYAITDIEAYVKDGRFGFRILGTKMMTHMIHDIKVAQKEQKLFIAEYRQLPEVDHIAAERFQSRPGRGAGTTVEGIAMMLGAMMNELPDTPIQFYTAAVWKNEFNRTAADLKEMYADLDHRHKMAREEAKKNKTKYVEDVVIHQVDSFLISLYHAAKVLGVKPYSFISSFKDEAKLMETLRKAPTL